MGNVHRFSDWRLPVLGIIASAAAAVLAALADRLVVVATPKQRWLCCRAGCCPTAVWRDFPGACLLRAVPTLVESVIQMRKVSKARGQFPDEDSSLKPELIAPPPRPALGSTPICRALRRRRDEHARIATEVLTRRTPPVAGKLLDRPWDNGYLYNR
jgi:hypothetical protein